MNLNFAAVLQALGADAVFRIANEVRPMAEYLFATLLPERNMPTYDAKSGSMTVRATMAGLVGMDSPYPPTGITQASTFAEQTAKVANQPYLPEQALRTLQQLLQAGNGRGVVTIDQTQEALNFLDKVVIQPHLDTAEYLRSEALVFGAIDWTFNAKRLQVNYGVPAGNFLPNRTLQNSYGGTTSQFWADIAQLQSILRYNVRAYIASTATINLILRNTANSLALVAQNGAQFTVRRYVVVNGLNVPSSDARDQLTLIAYDKEGEILNVADPSTTIRVPMMPDGKILAVGNNDAGGYRVGLGSTDDPALDNALGYTHIAPTVEAGGVPGRWAELFVPPNMPMQLHGRGVSNLLPVIEAPEKIAVASTNMTTA